jgi:hypothetical protein
VVEDVDEDEGVISKKIPMSHLFSSTGLDKAEKGSRIQAYDNKLSISWLSLSRYAHPALV